MYKRSVDTNTTINDLIVGAINIQFGIGSILLVGSLTVMLLVGTVEFHIIKANMPFLLYLSNIDAL